jgi:DNA polymerase elongation subunit (family B)
MNIYIDIETIPDGEPDLSGLVDPDSIVVLHDDPEIKVDRRLKDPAKIEAAREAGRERLQEKRREEAVKAREAAVEAWRKGSLSPLAGRVLCVGVAVEDAGPVVIMEDTEEATLSKLEKGLARYRDQRPRLWTWNGGRFDRPFLAKRALRHKLYTLAGICRIEKPWLADDLYQVWGMGDQRAKGRLDDVCDLLGISRDGNPIDGSEVLDRYLAGDLDAIREHCIDDVRVLQLIGREFRAAGWLE